MARYPWAEIRERFIKSNCSLAEVGREFGVSLPSMKLRSRKEQWVAAREHYRNSGQLFPFDDSTVIVPKATGVTFFDYLYSSCIRRIQAIDRVLDQNLKRYQEENIRLRPQELVALGRLNFEIARYISAAEAWIEKTKEKSIADMTDEELDQAIRELES